MADSIIKPQPQNGLITETGQQYYQGAQGFRGDGTTKNFTTTFNTDLIWYTADPTNVNYGLNNFKLYTSTTAVPGSWSEVTTGYTVEENIIKYTAAPVANLFIVVQLKILDGGKYGNTQGDKAYGEAVEDNYGGYQYVKLEDIVNNFIVAYIGAGKLIPNAKRTEIVFFAKRGIQEFSYDTLKSIKSSELTIPSSLTLVLPQDYVNYVKMSWVDGLGVLHPLYPTNNLTLSPYNTQIQDSMGIPTQDNWGNDIEGTSITQDRWHSANDKMINGAWNLNDFTNDLWAYNWDYTGTWFGSSWGQLFGLEPQTSQSNGWFNINEREGKISFSSNLANRLMILEYVSDGLATDMDSRIPKLAEEALYAYISHAILATRVNQPEYIIQRYKREASAKLRNAKIRLSNIKLDEIVQVMRGKSKWIKH
tara:strand:- start:8628 stop:9890 length:1263 start_codon:yes stop_codon:yes gene_type:complete